MPIPPSPPHDGHPADHHRGLQADLAAMQAQARRQTLGWLAGLGSLSAWPLLGCGGGGDASTANGGGSNPSSTVTASDGNGGTCNTVPTETQGPYPADGSNSVSGSVVNALSLSGIARSDIRSSVGSASGTAAGVP